jgi:hypothetical protein
MWKKVRTRLSYFFVCSIINKFSRIFDALCGHRQSTQCENRFLCSTEIFYRMKNLQSKCFIVLQIYTIYIKC